MTADVLVWGETTLMVGVFPITPKGRDWLECHTGFESTNPKMSTVTVQELDIMLTQMAESGVLTCQENIEPVLGLQYPYHVIKEWAHEH